MTTTVSHPSEKVKGVRRHALIYFVCGNPGLINFYADFFTNLRGLLNGSEGETAYDIYGRDFLGFSDDDHEPFGQGNDPYDLNDQIEGIWDDVAARRKQDGQPYDFVVLMGHSVGTYIAVEIFHRHMKQPSRTPHLSLKYGFLLFPTLTHIGQSPSGARLELLRRHVPLFDATAHIAAALLVGLFSEATLRWLVARLLGFTPSTAAVCAAWLKSRDGIWQSIHLAKSEMETIRDDAWEDELWEVAEEHADGTDTPKFFMFYGRHDHWVANHLRDDFIARRREHGERGGRTSIVVDEGDLPHAFCTRENSSWVVAKKVHEWVEEIERNRKQVE